MIEVNSNSFQQEVLDSEQTILVDFWAPWCGPCRAQAPVLEQLAVERTDIKVVKLNVDESPEIAMAFRVESIPTMIVFKDGQAINKVIGLHSLADLKNIL